MCHVLQKGTVQYVTYVMVPEDSRTRMYSYRYKRSVWMRNINSNLNWPATEKQRKIGIAHTRLHTYVTWYGGTKYTEDSHTMSEPIVYKSRSNCLIKPLISGSLACSLWLMTSLWRRDRMTNAFSIAQTLRDTKFVGLSIVTYYCPMYVGFSTL